MVPLSEEEQRLLEQMEEALTAEDPQFVSALRGASSRRHHKRIVIFAAMGFLVGVVLLMTGAVLSLTIVAVAGFVVMLGCAYAALTHGRRLGEPELPDNVHRIDKVRERPTSSGESSGFMNRMEDRWRRRRDDY